MALVSPSAHLATGPTAIGECTQTTRLLTDEADLR